MHLTPEQYHRFINGQCSPEEENYWIDFFQKHPDLLEKYIDVDHWEQFRSDGLLHPAVSERIRENIKKNIRRRHRVKRSRKLLAAALCVGIITLAFNWIFVRSKGAGHENVSGKKNNSTQPAWFTITNPTDTVMALVLSDQSKVNLYPGSSIRFKKIFDTARRDVYLTGEANFQVMKNKRRPFTVYASGVATTALGTSFQVLAVPGKQVQVKLFTGKVVIRPMNHTWNNVYLRPGEKFTLHDEQNKYVVTRIDNTGKPEKHTRPRISKKNKTIASLLAFENTPLAEVFRRLDSIYAIKIRYNKKDIQDVFVTATFNEQDTPDSILETLCTLNHLNITKNKDGFIITP